MANKLTYWAKQLTFRRQPNLAIYLNHDNCESIAMGKPRWLKDMDRSAERSSSSPRLREQTFIKRTMSFPVGEQSTAGDLSYRDIRCICGNTIRLLPSALTKHCTCSICGRTVHGYEGLTESTKHGFI